MESDQRQVGLLYDERMCNHYLPGRVEHVEIPDRIRFIWKELQSTGITDRCVLLEAKEAEDDHLLSVHTKNHVDLIKNISSKKHSSRKRIASELDSICFNEGSSEAAYLAAGSAVEVVKRVASRELQSAVAVVRPPGHHAERDAAKGFCLFNNVAVAASYLLDKRPELGVKKILIVDWDVHHGNGTQKMFWNDSRVLFFSVHRHESGSFYPANDDGHYTMTGEGAGAGYNINVPWENARCGDADYIAVWDHILLPVTKEFNPDIIIVSAGFDAAVGDPLGGCCVTPFGYSVLLKKLLRFAEGRIVLVLEGGYNLDSIAKSMHACLEVLLEDKPLNGSSEAYPLDSTWDVIQVVRQELSPFWPTLACDILQHSLISDPNNSGKLVELLEDVKKPLSKLNVNAGMSSSGGPSLEALAAALSSSSKRKHRDGKRSKTKAGKKKKTQASEGADSPPPSVHRPSQSQEGRDNSIPVPRFYSVSEDDNTQLRETSRPSIHRRQSVQDAPPQASFAKFDLGDEGFDPLDFMKAAWKENNFNDFSDKSLSDEESLMLTREVIYHSQRAQHAAISMMNGARRAVASLSESSAQVAEQDSAIFDLSESLKEKKKELALAQDTLKKKNSELLSQKTAFDQLQSEARLLKEAANRCKEAEVAQEQEAGAHRLTLSKLKAAESKIAELEEAFLRAAATYRMDGFEAAKEQAVLLQPNLDTSKMLIFGKIVDGAITGPPNPIRSSSPGGEEEEDESDGYSEDEEMGEPKAAAGEDEWEEPATNAAEGDGEGLPQNEDDLPPTA